MGDPSLLRAVALEWLKSFDEDKVAEKFDIDPRAVARIIAKPEIREYISKRMIPLEDIATAGARRLLEEALKTAFDPDKDWKERTENRKLLARTLLPELKQIKVEHSFIEAPKRATSVEEWTANATAPKVIEAVIVDE